MLGYIVVAVIAALLVLILALWVRGERGFLPRPSTKRFFREAGFGLQALHGYIYARWTRQYVDVLLNRLPANPRGMKWLSDHYHGKVLPHEHAEAIVKLDRDIPLRDLEQVVPYPVARELVLKGPPDVAAYECVCRHARANRCSPTQVCMVIGQPFVDMILEHHPGNGRRLSQAEALELLRAEHDRGHVHSAWFKDAMLNRFYAICNCCKCCCGGIEAMTKRSTPMMTASGYVVEVNQELCNACGVCVEMCAFDALRLNDSAVSRDWERCMGCGVCVDQCTEGAMSLVREEKKGIPLDVRALA